MSVEILYSIKSDRNNVQAYKCIFYTELKIKNPLKSYKKLTWKEQIQEDDDQEEDGNKIT